MHNASTQRVKECVGERRKRRARQRLCWIGTREPLSVIAGMAFCSLEGSWGFVVSGLEESKGVAMGIVARVGAGARVWDGTGAEVGVGSAAWSPSGSFQV